MSDGFTPELDPDNCLLVIFFLRRDQSRSSVEWIGIYVKLTFIKIKKNTLTVSQKNRDEKKIKIEKK